MNIEEYRLYDKERIESNKKRMEEGVEFLDIYSAFIDDSVVIERGAVICNNVTLKGKTVVKSGARIGQSSVIVDSVIGEGSEIKTSYILGSEIGNNTDVGPFAYIRPGSRIGEGCHIGDFVEIKNSTFGDGSKSAHLTYVGDADIGKRVNLGCGIVFVNYDGHKKYRSTIGDDAFIGCNTNIISPVNVGEGAYVAAATTVTDDVPSDALCIGRSRQSVKENWVKKRKILKKDIEDNN